MISLPPPVSYASRIASPLMISPPVGKSGPLIILSISSSEMRGLSIMATVPSMTSAKLCVGMLVARPTAIPVAPLTRRFGKRPGRISGSLRVSSKFSDHLTVSFSISRKSSMASGAMRASVYRKAAAESPSIEPKLPCPSTSVARMEKSCAMRTMVS